MYKGWISAVNSVYFNRQTWNDKFAMIRYASKKCLITQDPNIIVTRLPTIVGDAYFWEVDIIDRYAKNNNTPPIIGLEKHMAFENCEFKTKFEIGDPYRTASSCACSLTCHDFRGEMFLHNLWPLLPSITFDTTDPQNVKKYIEGSFTFVKQGSSINIVGLE